MNGKLTSLQNSFWKLCFHPRTGQRLLAVLIGLVLVFPFLPLGDFVVSVAVLVMLYMILAVGLNIVPGFCGLLDLGYVGFYAVGAYTSALLTVHFDLSFWTIIPLAAINGAIWGILLGIPTLRLTGDYFAIVTFGFSEMVVLMIRNERWLTRGPLGIPGIAPPGVDLEALFHPPGIYWFAAVLGGILLLIAYRAWRRRDRRYLLAFGLLLATFPILFLLVSPAVGTALPYEVLFREVESFYYLIFAMLAVIVIAVRRLKNSRVGRAWVAIREDALAAQSVGIDLVKFKVTAFAISAAVGAIAGAFIARWFMFVGPAMFMFWESFLILCCIVLGGLGSIPAVMVGAAALMALGEILRVVLPALGIDPGFRFAFYGLIMVLVMRFVPHGIVPGIRQRIDSLRRLGEK